MIQEVSFQANGGKKNRCENEPMNCSMIVRVFSRMWANHQWRSRPKCAEDGMYPDPVGKGGAQQSQRQEKLNTPPGQLAWA